jgi:RNA polymerase sigma factor (sigma-70 family)
MTPSDYESDTTESLLRDYRLSSAEGPLCQLIARYLPLVFSTARRRTGSETLAADVTQAVFCDFARHARSLPANFQPGGWLLRHTGFLASRSLRSERRRVARETEAARQAQLETDMTAPSSRHIELDAAIRRLAAADQTILVLRYYEEQKAPDIATRLGISASAAQKRIERALHRLRRLLPGKPAIPVITAGITALLSPDSARAATPSSLLASVTSPTLAAAALPLTRAGVWLRHLKPVTGAALGSATALLVAAGPLISYAASRQTTSPSAVRSEAVKPPQPAAPKNAAPPTAADIVDELISLVDREGFNRVVWNKAERLIRKIPPGECGEAILLVTKAFPVHTTRGDHAGPERWLQLLLHFWKPVSPDAGITFLLPKLDPALRDGAAMSLCQAWFRKDPSAATSWFEELLADSARLLLPDDCRNIVLRRLGYCVLSGMARTDPARAAGMASRMEEQGITGLTSSLTNKRIIAEARSLASEALSLPDHPANKSLQSILDAEASPSAQREMADKISDPVMRREFAPILASQQLRSGSLNADECRRTADWLMAQGTAEHKAAALRRIVSAWMECDEAALSAWLLQTSPEEGAALMDRQKSSLALRSSGGIEAAITRALTIQDEALRDYTLAALTVQQQDRASDGAEKVLQSPALPVKTAETLRRALAIQP